MNYKGGFTLLEVLLGLSIFLIISAGLYTALIQGIKIQQRTEQKNIINREATRIMGQLTRDLENMIYYDFSNSYPFLRPFQGKDNRLSLILVKDSRLKVISYYLEPKSSGSSQEESCLIREETPFWESLQTASKINGEAKILGSHLKAQSLRFWYAYLEKNGNEPQFIWNNSWEEQFVPAGVRIDFVLFEPQLPQDSFVIRKEVFIPTGSWGNEPL